MNRSILIGVASFAITVLAIIGQQAAYASNVIC